jgi:hypothetical protein
VLRVDETKKSDEIFERREAWRLSHTISIRAEHFVQYRGINLGVKSLALISVDEEMVVTVADDLVCGG